MRASFEVSSVWRTSNSDSTGISASALKARAYGVSLTGFLGVVR